MKVRKASPNTQLIIGNAERLRALHGEVHALVPGRSKPNGRELWAEACRNFHAAYDALAFPGGLENGLEKIKLNDASAIEAALDFLEIRPYFFRSQYIRTKLLRLLKRAQLDALQIARLQTILTTANKAPASG